MLNKIFVAVFTIGVFATSSFAGDMISREHPYLYKSPRAMGMGGAYVAIGGSADTLFYNPAGLGNLPEDEGWEYNMLGLSGELSENALDIINDMKDAFDLTDVDGDGDDSDEQLAEIVEILAKYRGDNTHLGLSAFGSMAKKSGKIAFALGGIGTARADSIAHQGLGSNGLFDVNAQAHYGGLGGISYDAFEGLSLGAAVKFLHRESLVESFTAQELIDNQDTLEDYLFEDLRESGNAFGLDVGAIYNIPKLNSLKPSVGLSFLNVGDMDFGDAGKMPMTVNLCFSINPDIPTFKSLIVALDYVDMFNNYSQDSDIGKRLRFGGELCLFSKKAIGAMLRTGLYQGYATFGADLRLTIVTLSYVTYAEEVGAYAGQDDDRRHLAMINIGW